MESATNSYCRRYLQLDILRPEQNGYHFADKTLKYIALKWNRCIQISLIMLSTRNTLIDTKYFIVKKTLNKAVIQNLIFEYVYFTRYVMPCMVFAVSDRCLTATCGVSSRVPVTGVLGRVEAAKGRRKGRTARHRPSHGLKSSRTHLELTSSGSRVLWVTSLAHPATKTGWWGMASHSMSSAKRRPFCFHLNNDV